MVIRDGGNGEEKEKRCGRMGVGDRGNGGVGKRVCLFCVCISMCVCVCVCKSVFKLCVVDRVNVGGFAPE